MVYFYQQILAGLDKVPTPNHPGTLIVTGDSQAIFTGQNAGDTILAACLYGKGKIFVAAHSCYLEWLHEKNDETKKRFMNNVKSWMTNRESVGDCEIINVKEAINKNRSFKNYKIIEWHHDDILNEKQHSKLLSYIKEGGSCFLGTTAWGYLQLNPTKHLQDIPFFNFLKTHTGIILTKECLSLPDTETNVSENKAKHSHFDVAIEKIGKRPEKIEKYYNTLCNGLACLRSEGNMKDDQIVELKNLVLKRCSGFGWNTRPSEKHPICNSNEKNAIKLLGKCLELVETGKAPGVDDFPGDFTEKPKLLENVDLEINAKFEETVSTGYYLPAGITLLVSVSLGDTNGWKIRIGAHTDDLSNCDKFNRWPCVTVERCLSSEFGFSSPFGGLIYFESSGAGQIKVMMTNVVESPYFDLLKPQTVDDWNRRKNVPGLWAELAGENIIFTTPSECVRNIENPVDVLRFWDRVMQAHHECRGTNPKDYRRERVVNDRQPSCGYMHSGYPIVTHLDCCQPGCDECIFEIDKLKPNGNWGLFHELGHNMQRGEWTFDGCTEVTVNIFSMHATQFVIGKDILDQKWPRDRIEEFAGFFAKQPTYESWKDHCCMALMTFAQLIKHFGWQPMKKFMKDYEDDIKNNRSNLPAGNQDKIDQWVIRYSKIISRNIKPQFEMWGLPVSKSVDEHVGDFKQWLPIDEKDSKVFFSKL